MVSSFCFRNGAGNERELTGAWGLSKLSGMEVHFTPELEAKLSRIAAQQGCNAESVVHEAVERLLGHDEWFIREVEHGLKQIERGEVLTHEEVGVRMEKLLAEKRQRT